GTVRIAADSGALVSSNGWMPKKGEARRHSLSHSSDEETLASLSPSRSHIGALHQRLSEAVSDDEIDSHKGETIRQRANRYGASIVNFSEKIVGKTTHFFQKAGRWFQKQLTDENTLEPNQELKSDKG